ncbi:MAG TPA: MFS transporter [Mycobacteriales bacterium]|nr:MFS transporter [Mycobacteriales bacterium]
MTNRRGGAKPKPKPDSVEVIEIRRDELRRAARAAVGVDGVGNKVPLRRAFREHGLSVYPLLALCGLVIVDQFQLSAFGVLSPEVSTGLGISVGSYTLVYALRMLALSVAALPMAALVQRRPCRASVAIVTAFAWSAMTVFTGFSGGLLALIAVFVADGASSGSVQATHGPLLFDVYPPDLRSRVYAIFTSSTYVALVLGPALVALLTYWDLTWRGVFLVLGVLCLIVATAAVRLRDPGFGRWDIARVREVVKGQQPAAEAEAPTLDNSLRFFEAARRVFAVGTIRRLLVGQAFFGMFLAPLISFLSFFLQDQFDLGPTARGIFSAVLPIPAIGLMWLVGTRGERWYAQSPSRVLRYAGLALGASVVLLAISIALPTLIAFSVVFMLAYAGMTTALPLMGLSTLGLLPPQVRAHASALGGIATYGAGALIGSLFLDSIDTRYGVTAAIVALTVPGLISAGVVWSASRLVDADLDRFIDGIVEEQEVRELQASGTKMPMLACRHIDFSYGQLQVLFDVSFSVADGEMVALLGTNGAGKSTLLRVISGLGLPTSGSVRLDGADITYLEPHRRVDAGIMQIAGGKGTFGKLTVVDNLRAFGYRLGSNRRAVEAGMDTVFDAFPRLAERRDQLAATMSGGENQMLALGCAFMLKPRLLLIDELSLGLAPRVVGELLEMVRRINAGGASVVLVEQSVNIALSLVDHAYFMEKGEVRFDGKAGVLVERGDLLRSVFLEGAAKGIAV